MLTGLPYQIPQHPSEAGNTLFSVFWRKQRPVLTSLVCRMVVTGAAHRLARALCLPGTSWPLVVEQGQVTGPGHGAVSRGDGFAPRQKIPLLVGGFPEPLSSAVTIHSISPGSGARPRQGSSMTCKGLTRSKTRTSEADPGHSDSGGCERGSDLSVLADRNSPSVMPGGLDDLLWEKGVSLPHAQGRWKQVEQGKAGPAPPGKSCRKQGHPHFAAIYS